MVVAVPARAAYLLLDHRARLPEHLQLPDYRGRHVAGVDYGIGSDLRHSLRRHRPLGRLCDGHGVSCRGPGYESDREQRATVRGGPGWPGCRTGRWPHSRSGERPGHCPTACAALHRHTGYVRHSSWRGLYSLRRTACQYTDEWHRSDRQWVPALPPARRTFKLLPPALKFRGRTSQSDCATAALSLASPGRCSPSLCLAALADALWKTYVRCWRE